MMVKICGITTQEDAAAAAGAGADAIGFNFYSRSPRYIDPSAAAAIDAGVLRVGVFVDEPPHRVAAVARTARLDIVQLHGSEDPLDYAPLRIWKAFRISGRWEMPEVSGAEAILLDGPVPGSGAQFNWSERPRAAGRIILAGGLGPDNVADAIRLIRPWGVDACSRIEKRPGVKDHDKMRLFIQAAHTVTL